jgi:hypothetical protein
MSVGLERVLAPPDLPAGCGRSWTGQQRRTRREDLGVGIGEDLRGWTWHWHRPRELFVCNLPRRCDVEDLL